MMSLGLVLQVAALVCLVCAAAGVPSGRVGIGWAGLSLWLLSTAVGGVVLR